MEMFCMDEFDIVKDALERPELYNMKPQQEGGGNNIYGEDAREALLKLQKIVMQPTYQCREFF
ncbi:hypothetical protein KY285_019713 [Solanum tuberosum]|nr:hypothetical protein KY285_019713 [Solanum tuberosum]